MRFQLIKPLILIGYLAGGNLFAQPKLPAPFESFNGFITATQSKPDADSAMYHLRNLASEPKALKMMEDMAHNFFAQAFIDPALIGDKEEQWLIRQAAQRDFSKKLIIRIMADSNATIRRVFAPLYALDRIQEAGQEIAIAKLAADFATREMGNENLYTNRIGRYALLIYAELVKYPALREQANTLYTTTITKLKNGQIDKAVANSRVKTEERAWYRYLYAYANAMPSAPGSPDPDAKEARLKVANDFSPDQTDRAGGSSAYFYDAVMLQGRFNDTFQDEYFEHLKSNGGDVETMLRALTQMTLDTPGLKAELQDLYATSKSSTKPFAEYWTEQVNTRAVQTPKIVLTKTDKLAFHSADLAGKWILVDFWGTWCGPCRQEHPDLQNFYENTVSKQDSKIALLTVACRDTEAKVLDYMGDKKFSFPVAMADQEIEKTFKITGYPTKLLITPQGKYVIVPFGINWKEFVIAYANL